MKRLFSIFLSLHLILSPVAFAQGDEFRQGDSSKSGGAGFYASQILALGTGLVGSSIISSCTLCYAQPSMITFMGGSLVYIASEILGGKDQGNFLLAKASDLKMQDGKLQGGDMQKEVLEAALQNEKQNRDFIKKRKIWLFAVGTIYTAATALAVLEGMRGAIPLTAGSDMADCHPGGGLVHSELLKIGVIGAYTMFATKAGGDGAITTYGGMAIALGAITKSLDATIIPIFNFGFPRAFTFGVASALSFTVAGSFVDKQNKAETNIEKLEKVIAAFKKDTDPGGDGVEKDDPYEKKDDKDPKIDPKIKALAEADVPKHCLGQSNGKLDYSDKACGNVIKITKPNFQHLGNLPTLQAVSNMSSEMAQAVANGDMKRADMLAGDLSSMAARVKSIRDDAVKKWNENNKAAGKPAINFDQKVADQIKSMQAELDKGLGSAGAAALAAADKAELNSDKNVQASAPVTTASAPSTVPLAEPSLSFTESTPEDVPAVTTASLDSSLDQYESTVQDISKKSEASIFKQVSNRYILNYNKIFREKKKLEAAEAN